MLQNTSPHAEVSDLLDRVTELRATLWDTKDQAHRAIEESRKLEAFRLTRQMSAMQKLDAANMAMRQSIALIE